MIDGVFGQIADGAAEHLRISSHPDGLAGAKQRDILALRKR